MMNFTRALGDVLARLNLLEGKVPQGFSYEKPTFHYFSC